MNAEEFEKKLIGCSEAGEFVKLLEEVCNALLHGMKVPLAKQCIARLLESEFKPSADSLCLDSLMYVYNQKALEIARMIFEKIGVPDSLAVQSGF